MLVCRSKCRGRGYFRTYNDDLCAATGAETLEGATISVFSDQDMLIPVDDYSEVLPGTYYYTVSKAGFVAEEGSVEIVDQM